MGSLIRPYFEALLLFLLAAGFYTLAATGRLGPAVLVAGSAAFLLRAVLLWRGIRPHLPSHWITTATLLYAVFYLADVYVFSRSFVGATAHLVVFIAILKLFSAQQARDYIYLCVIALLEILSAATLTVSSGFMVFFLVFLLLMIATFVAFEVFRAEERAAVVARDAAVSSRLRGSLFGFSLLLTSGVVVFGGLIFLLLPRTAFGTWAPPLDHSALSGFSDDVQLGEISNLQMSNEPVMHVRVLESRPPVSARRLAQLRWRGRVLTIFDGRRWYSPFHGILYRTVLGRLDFTPIDFPGQQRKLLRYSVTLEPLGSEVLFYPAQVLQTDTHYHALAIDSTGTIVSPQRGFGGTLYTGVSDLARPSPRELEQAGADYPASIRSRYLQLPPGLDARIPVLARQITAHRTNPYDQMTALEQYLRTNYRYTLHNLPTGRDPLATFLFDRKAGYCEYFASALAVMGRSLGIPTRVVNGFLSGQYNDISGEYVIRGRDAHSWVEAWFPLGEHGIWVPFDGTASTPEDLGGGWSRAMLYLDAISSTWQEWVINYDWMHQLRLAHQVQSHVEQNALQARRYFDDGPNHLQERLRAWLEAMQSRRSPAVPVGLGLGGLLLILVVLGRTGRLPWRWTLGRRDAAAARAWQAQCASRSWQRLQRRLRRAGYLRQPAETPEEFVQRLAPGGLREALVAYLRHYEHLRFGHAADEREALRALETAFQMVRRNLRIRTARAARPEAV